MIAEADGSRWVDLERGDRSEASFLRLLARLPETGQYRSDPYGVYGGLPRNRHVSGKGGAVNGNEGLRSGCNGRRKGTPRARRCGGIPWPWSDCGWG